MPPRLAPTILPTLLSRLLALAFVPTLAACGGDDDGDDGGDGGGPDAQVAVTPAALEGTWASPPAQFYEAQHNEIGEPTVLRIDRVGGGGNDDADLIGEAQGYDLHFTRGPVEVLPATNPGVLALLNLVGDRSVGQPGFGELVSGLTADTLETTGSNGTRTWRRQSACAAPLSWIGDMGGPTTPMYAPDGTLYVNGGVQLDVTIDRPVGLFRVRPGRCRFEPVDASLLGRFARAPEDGVIEGLGVRVLSDNTELVYERLTVAADGSADKREETVANGRPSPGSNQALVTLPDGRIGALDFVAATIAPFTREADGTWRAEPEVVAGQAAFNPLAVEVTYDRAKHPRVRAHGAAEGARWDGAAWVLWEVPRHREYGTPGALASDEGPAGKTYAAFREDFVGGASVVILGVSGDEGATWDTWRVGLGGAWWMRVRPDGVVDMAVPPSDTRDMTGIEARPDAVAGYLARQRYFRYEDSLLPAAVDRIQEGHVWHPVAAFGPDGRSFIGNSGGGFRHAGAERGARELTQQVALTADAEVPFTLEVPALGLTCTDSCDLRLGQNEITALRVTSDGRATLAIGLPETPTAAINAELVALGDGEYLLRTGPIWDETQRSRVITLGLTLTTRAVATATTVLVPDGDGGGAPHGLAQMGDDAVVAVGAAIERRRADGTLAAALPAGCSADVRGTLAASDDEVRVVGGFAGCAGVPEGVDTIVWLEDDTGTLRATASLTVRDDPTASALAAKDIRFDDEGRAVWGRWADNGSDVIVRRVAADGAASETTLSGPLTLVSALEPLDGGALMVPRDDGSVRGVAVYGADGALRWERTLDAQAVYTFFARADGDRVVVAFAGTRTLTFGDVSYTHEGPAALKGPALVVTLDAATGATRGDVLRQPLDLGRIASVARVGAGAVILSHYPNATLFDVFTKDRHEHHAWIAPNATCLGASGDCVWQPTWLAPTGEGGAAGVWGLTAIESELPIEGEAVTAGSPRGLLFAWRTPAWWAAE